MKELGLKPRKILCLVLLGLITLCAQLFGEDSLSGFTNARDISATGTTENNVVVDSAIDFSGVIKGSVKIISGGILNLLGTTVGDLEVYKGGQLNVLGQVVGDIVDRGGEITIQGQLTGKLVKGDNEPNQSPANARIIEVHMGLQNYFGIEGRPTILGFKVEGFADQSPFRDAGVLEGDILDSGNGKLLAGFYSGDDVDSLRDQLVRGTIDTIDFKVLRGVDVSNLSGRETYTLRVTK